MISTQKNFLFIHVPKTGGNSVQNVLRHYSEDKIVKVAHHQDGIERFEVRNDLYSIEKHSSLAQYAEVLDQRKFKDLYKFSILRNPWERMISYYFSPNRMISSWDRDAFIHLINRVLPIRSYISLDPTNKDRRIDLDIDVILKFENLEVEFKQFCERISIPLNKLPHINKSTHKYYSFYYDDELVSLVHHKFRDEVELGNYTFRKL